MNTALSKTGARRLAEAEAKIERGLSTFWEVGNALMQIRDERLYRSDFQTFEDYCQQRWGMTRRRANQLVEAAQMGTMVPIENERQARALAPVKEDPAEVREIYAEAKRRGDTSGAGLASVVAERKPPPDVDPDTGEITTSSGSDQSAPQSDAAGSGDDEQTEAPAPSPAPKVAPETIEQRNAREAEERRLDRNVSFGKHLIGMWALLGNGDKPIDDLIAGWVPEECPMWLVEAHRPVFTPDGMRDLARTVEKLAAKWEAADV